MNPEVTHKPSQPHSNDAKLTVPAGSLDWITKKTMLLFAVAFRI
jgi:hypothetical protein